MWWDKPWTRMATQNNFQARNPLRFAGSSRFLAWRFICKSISSVDVLVGILYDWCWRIFNLNLNFKFYSFTPQESMLKNLESKVREQDAYWTKVVLMKDNEIESLKIVSEKSWAGESSRVIDDVNFTDKRKKIVFPSFF